MYRNRALSLAVVGAAGVSIIAPVTALADSEAISINRIGRLSASHQTAFIRATVICSEDTVSGTISARLTQLSPAGGVQSARARVNALNAVECTGEEETFSLAVRRPSGGYKWQRGTAVVRDFRFSTTEDDDNWNDRGRRGRLSVNALDNDDRNGRHDGRNGGGRNGEDRNGGGRNGHDRDGEVRHHDRNGRDQDRDFCDQLRNRNSDLCDWFDNDRDRRDRDRDRNRDDDGEFTSTLRARTITLR